MNENGRLLQTQYVISCDKMQSWEYEGVEQVDDDLTLMFENAKHVQILAADNADQDYLIHCDTKCLYDRRFNS